MYEIEKRENLEEQINEHDDSVSLSRRSFVASVGALVSLPVVAGGVLMPVWTDEALAAEGDPASDISKIIVVKKNEFGVFVGDVAEGKKTPIANANVKLVSSSTGKEVTGATDAKGKVCLDISKIAKLEKDENGVEAYAFYGQLDVSAPGYRNYRTGRIAVMGGRGTMAPTRKVDNTEIYPQMVTFDDWDVLYTANAFAVTVGNDVKHTFNIEFVTTLTTPVTVSLYTKEASDPIATQKVTPANGLVKVQFSDYFLLTNHNAALAVGKRKVHITVFYKDKQLRVDLAMETQAAPNKATAPGTAKVTLKPFDPNGLKPSITMPKWVPLLGGKVINVWTPDLPLSVWFDPYGFIKFVARTGELGYQYKEKDGKVKEDGWKYHPRKSSEDQWTEANNERKALLDKVGKAIRKGGLLQSVSYTSNLNATAMLQIAAAGKWRDDEALWRMGVSMQAVLAFNVSYAQQFMVGPIPAIFEFSFLSSITIGVSGNVATTELFDISKYSWDYGNSGISVTLVLAPSISFGIGLKGLLSASIQGQLSFSFCVAVRTPPHDAGSDLKNPHLVMGLVAQVNVVVQAFIFSKTFNLWEVGDPTWFDNWNGKVPGESSKGLSTQAGEPELTDFATGMEIVKDEWLAEVGEFSSEGFDETNLELTTQSESAPAFVVEEQRVSTDNGVSYQCTTFTPAGLVENTPVATVREGDDDVSFIAGASPALSTQAVQTQADPSLPPSADYTTTDSGKYKAFVEEHSTKRFKGIASQSGLVPANDVCVAKDVFSDPRVKAIRIGDKTHVFRISTVKVGNNSRTRVVGQALNGNGGEVGAMTVYDFNPVLLDNSIFSLFTPTAHANRNDMYDYDFDVVFTPGTSFRFDANNWISDLISGRKIMGILTFFVISGRRGGADQTNYAQAACDQMFSIVRYIVRDDGTSVLEGSTASVTNDAKFDAAGGGTTHPYHSFSCPQISVLGNSPDAGVAGWMVTYLDRAGKTPDEAVSASSKVGLGLAFLDSLGRVNAVKVDKPPAWDNSTYEMTCSARFNSGQNEGWHLVMMRGREKVVYCLLQTRLLPEYLIGTDVKPLMSMKAIEPAAKEGSEPMRLVDWPGHAGTFLTSHGGKLQKVTINGLSGSSPSFKYEDCGPTGFNVNSFGVDPSGNVIFWPACSEDNAGYSYDEKGNGTKRKWSEVHQIMGSRLRNGKFSDPFVYGEVKHDMHVMHVLDYLNANTLTILSVDMKDATKGHADLWFTSIPLVKCANVVGCEAASPFNYPGEKALFYLTVRNDGNTYLSGFTANLAEHGKSPVRSAKLEFSKATLCESGYNQVKGGTMENVEPDYALAPGKTAVFQAEIEIPADWKDEKKVTVSASNAVVAGSGGLKTQAGLTTQAGEDEADDGVEEYIIASGEYGNNDYDDELENGEGQAPFDFLTIWYEDTYDDDNEEEYLDAPIVDADKENNNATGNKPTPASSTPSSTKRTSVKTGDDILPFGLMAAALAAAGAGMAAYSKRRYDNEKEKNAAEE